MLKSSYYKKINNILIDLLTKIPEPRTQTIKADIDDLIRNASLKSAALSGALSLPAGLLAAATLLPDIVAVWKIQARLVADIAQVNNKHHLLTRETLLYCLFGAGQSASEDLVVRIGERFVVRRSSQKIFDGMLGKIGLRIGRNLLGERISRWIPFIGAALISRYSYKDTEKVGKAAEELFSSSIDIEN
ncbi:MAG: hypothetical protein ABL930_11830 [Pseudobdellovibrio sp.]